jgi:transcriptional regulator with XRE-family HTH domain
MDILNICEMLAQRVRQARFDANLTQAELAARAMISLPAYQRFEKTGQTSLATFVKILVVLDRENDLRGILARTDTVSSLEEFEQRHRPSRLRVRKPKNPA